MRKLILLFTSLWPVLMAHSQKIISPTGDVTVADLEMKNCSFEPEAPAMKMLDTKDIHCDLFYYGTKIKTECRIRIKIFSEKGYKYATIRIPYFSKKGAGKIKELNGAIYNLDDKGKITVKKLANWDFFKDHESGNTGIVSFTFPGVKAGSIIEYRYTTIENDIISIDPWIIQGEIPVAYTSVMITTPVSAGVSEWVMGADSVDKTWELLKYDQFRRKIYSKTNIPSFKAEPFMSAVRDHLVKTVFELFPNGDSYYESAGSGSAIWNMVGSQLLNSDFFRKQISTVIPGTETLTDSAKKITSLTSRINFIYSAVQQRWQAGGEQTYQVKELAEAWKDKSGPTAVANLILLNLLDKAGIKSFPVLISTRSHGRINKDFPSLGQVNGIDIMAFDTTNFYMLDASIRYQPFNIPPANILNREVFIMVPDSMYWATIVDERPLFKQSATIIAEMNADGKMEGSANIQYFDYAKSARLDTIQGDIDADEPGNFISRVPAGLKVLSSHKDVTEDPSDPMFETTEFTYEPQNTNEFYFINPWLFFERGPNPFLAEKRMTDIDLGSNQLIISSFQIDLKGMYEADDLPRNMTLITPDSGFIYKATYSVSADKVLVSQLFQVRRAIFSKDEYPVIRDFFGKMYGKMAEDIVLKKKK